MNTINSSYFFIPSYYVSAIDIVCYICKLYDVDTYLIYVSAHTAFIISYYPGKLNYVIIFLNEYNACLELKLSTRDNFQAPSYLQHPTHTLFVVKGFIMTRVNLSLLQYMYLVMHTL